MQHKEKTMSFMPQKYKILLKVILNLVFHLSIVRRTAPYFDLALPLLGEQLGIKKMGLLRISPLYHNPLLNKQNV